MTSAKAENNNNEWFTPMDVIDRVKKVFGGGIDLDPASCLLANQRVMAGHFYTKDDSGLSKEKDWFGRVFMNPPYSMNLLKPFLKKAVHEYNDGNIDEIIILTNSGTDTKWNAIISGGVQAYTIGRINFVYPDGTMAGVPSRGQVFTYFGPNPDKFIEVFTELGFCWIPNINMKLL